MDGGTVMGGSSAVDMATALDLTFDDAQEAKFTALRNLQQKKIKALMVSIDAKDKEIAKLKVLGKDNRRTQMIQVLKDKLREQELVTDVVKQELAQKGELTPEEVNGLIIRKTLGGPKRFRPMTREELENQVSDLEKKLAKAAGLGGGGGSVAGGRPAGSGSSVAGTQAGRSAAGAARSSSATQAGSRAGRSVAGAAAQNNRDLAAAAQQMLTSSNSSAAGGTDGGGGSSGADLVALAKMAEELHNLRILIDARDATIEQQKEDISRLRARNAELRAMESDFEEQERRDRETRMQLDNLADELEMTRDKLIKAEALLKDGEDAKANDNEEARAKLDGLQEHCEKLLKQNSALLKQLADVESEHEQVVYDLTKTAAEQAATSAGAENKDRKIAELEAKVMRLDEKRKALEAECADLTRENAQVKAQGEKLREANIRIRELEKTVQAVTEERDREVEKSKAAASDDVAEQLRQENKELKQALAVALAGADGSGSAAGK